MTNKTTYIYNKYKAKGMNGKVWSFHCVKVKTHDAFTTPKTNCLVNVLFAIHKNTRLERCKLNRIIQDNTQSDT